MKELLLKRPPPSSWHTKDVLFSCLSSVTVAYIVKLSRYPPSAQLQETAVFEGELGADGYGDLFATSDTTSSSSLRGPIHLLPANKRRHEQNELAQQTSSSLELN